MLCISYLFILLFIIFQLYTCYVYNSVAAMSMIDIGSTGEDVEAEIALQLQQLSADLPDEEDEDLDDGYQDTPLQEVHEKLPDSMQQYLQRMQLQTDRLQEELQECDALMLGPVEAETGAHDAKTDAHNADFGSDAVLSQPELSIKQKVNIYYGFLMFLG